MEYVKDPEWIGMHWEDWREWLDAPFKREEEEWDSTIDDYIKACEEERDARRNDDH